MLPFLTPLPPPEAESRQRGPGEQRCPVAGEHGDRGQEHGDEDQHEEAEGHRDKFADARRFAFPRMLCLTFRT